MESVSARLAILGWNEELNSIKYSEDMNEELPKANDKKICKYCKSKIDAKAKICPNCRKKQKSLWKRIVVAAIVIILAAWIFTPSEDTDANVVNFPASDNTSTVQNNDSTATQTEESETKDKVLIDNDTMKVTYEEIFEQEAVPDTCYIRFKVENKSAQKYTVYPDNLYVNDTATTMLSGVPMELDAGKQSQTPFFFTYSNLGISSKDEIKKIEVTFTAMNDDFETVYTSNSVVIEPNS